MAELESVRMATLKKAYAEIILNTSKEAASRIMAADRRALCFQKDLFVLKEDALRMLVQLKQMLDSKTAEADTRSENQQKKIEVLEAQLSEAEGIIVDLREELRLTEDKLEKLKRSQKQTLIRHISQVYQDQQLPFKNELISKADDVRCHTVQDPSTKKACATKYPAEMPLRNACEDQLIMSAQEQPSAPVQPPMLSYCNASVNTFNDFKSSKERDSPCCSKSEEKDVKITCNGSEPKSLEHESCHGQASRDGFRRTRKNVKYQEAIAALCRSSRGRRSKTYQPPSFSKCRSLRGRRAKTYQPPSFLKCRTYAGKRNEASIKVLDKNEMHSTPVSYGVSSSYEMNHNFAPEISNKRPLNPEFGETKGAAEKESDLSCDIDPYKFDTSLADCNLHDVQISEESEGISNRADNEKVLKFTFQRKRKREVLTKLDNNITPKVSNIMSRALLEQGDAVKLQKSISKDEQSKDSQQLLQVAHQLISLFGKGCA